MIKLWLKWYGKKWESSYWIVVMNSDFCCDGCLLEEFGFYNFRIDEIRLDVLGIIRCFE